MSQEKSKSNSSSLLPTNAVDRLNWTAAAKQSPKRNNTFVLMGCVTIFYLACVWACAIVFVQLSQLLHLPLVGLPRLLVSARLLYVCGLTALMSFLVGQGRGLRLPGRFSLLAWAVSMAMCTLCMESYLLDVDPATTPKWLVAWLNWSKPLPSYAFPLLFLASLNLFRIWRMTLVTRGLDATVERIVRREGGRTVARIAYVLGSIGSVCVGFQLFHQAIGSLPQLEPVVQGLERIAPVSLLPMALNLVIVGAWLGRCGDQWSTAHRISGWLVSQVVSAGLLVAFAAQQQQQSWAPTPTADADAEQNNDHLLRFTVTVVCGSYMVLYGLCAGLGMDVLDANADDYHRNHRHYCYRKDDGEEEDFEC